MTAAPFHEPPLESTLMPLQVFVHRPGGGGGDGIRGGFSFRGRSPLSLSHVIYLRARDRRITPDVYVARALKDEPMETVEPILDRLVWTGGIRKAWIAAYLTAAVRLHKELMALKNQWGCP